MTLCIQSFLLLNKQNMFPHCKGGKKVGMVKGHKIMKHPLFHFSLQQKHKNVKLCPEISFLQLGKKIIHVVTISSFRMPKKTCWIIRPKHILCH